MEYQSPAVTTRQVSVSEASRELGISPETVRRWIKSGRLQAERAIRPQGAVWLVALPVTPPCGVPPVAPVTAPHEGADQEPAHAPSAEACDPSPPVASVTGAAPGAVDPSPRPTPEVVALAATVREQAETIARLTRMLEQVMADMDALRASQASWELVDETEVPAPEPAPDPLPEPLLPTPNAAPWDAHWRAWVTIATAIIAVLAVAAAVAPTWLR